MSSITSPVLYGLTFPTAKEFDSVEAANKFMEANREYGCLAQYPEWVDRPLKVWVARLDDKGQPVKKEAGK